MPPGPAPPCSSPSTARPPTSSGPARPTRPRPSCRPRSCSSSSARPTVRSASARRAPLPSRVRRSTSATPSQKGCEMPITPTAKIWMNGDLVDWDQARVHVLTHTLHYGTGVFEGIRAYETPDGPAIFRLTDHIERLAKSARILMMDLPYSTSELVQACKDTVRST